MLRSLKYSHKQAAWLSAKLHNTPIYKTGQGVALQGAGTIAEAGAKDARHQDCWRGGR